VLKPLHFVYSVPPQVGYNVVVGVELCVVVCWEVVVRVVVACVVDVACVVVVLVVVVACVVVVLVVVVA